LQRLPSKIENQISTWLSQAKAIVPNQEQVVTHRWVVLALSAIIGWHPPLQELAPAVRLRLHGLAFNAGQALLIGILLPNTIESAKFKLRADCYPADAGLTSSETKMRFTSRAVLASALALSWCVLALTTTQSKAKSNILYCGSPGPGNCTAYPYRTRGGRESICAKNSPCYLSANCTGDQVCESHRPANAN